VTPLTSSSECGVPLEAEIGKTERHGADDDAEQNAYDDGYHQPCQHNTTPSPPFHHYGPASTEVKTFGGFKK